MRKKLLLILLISFLILISIMFIPLTINVVYKYSRGNSDLKIKLIILKYIKIPLIKDSYGKAEINEKQIKNNNIKKYLSYLRILRYLNINWRYLSINSKYGLGDPAYTAISYGIIWSFLGTIISNLNIKDTDIEISPNCQRKVLSLHIKSIFSIYIGNIIHTGFYILKEEIFNG